jgi:myo-inositol-1(or 4)-monophosphatase
MEKKIAEVAEEAAREAGRMLAKEYAKFKRSDVKVKGYTQLVTSADKKAEKIIIGLIKRNFPDHHILSEEAGDNEKKSDYFWIIDPLDGTTNFSFHFPAFAVSVAVAYKGEVVFGAVYLPLPDEMFMAAKDGGAYLNGKKIKVSAFGPERAFHTFCHGGRPADVKKAVRYYSYLKPKDYDIRQLGAASLELAYVACGRTDSIFIPGAKPWDVAAGTLLVSEAGGRVTDADDKDWSLKSKDMIATNGLVHKSVLEIVKKVSG